MRVHRSSTAFIATLVLVLALAVPTTALGAIWPMMGYDA